MIWRTILDFSEFFVCATVAFSEKVAAYVGLGSGTSGAYRTGNAG